MVDNQMNEKIISKKKEEQDIVSCDVDLPDSEQDWHDVYHESDSTMLQRRSARDDISCTTPSLVSSPDHT